MKKLTMIGLLVFSFVVFRGPVLLAADGVMSSVMSDMQLRQFVQNYYPTILRQEKKLLESELAQLIQDLAALEQTGNLLRNHKTQNALASFSLLAASPFLLRSLATMFHAPSMWQAALAAKKETLAAVVAGVILVYAFDFKYRHGTEQTKIELQLYHLQMQVSERLKKVAGKYQTIMEALVVAGDQSARREYLSQLQSSINNIDQLTGVIAGTASKYSGEVFTDRYLLPIFSLVIGPKFSKDLASDASLVSNRAVGWAGAIAVSVAVITTACISFNAYLQPDDDQQLLVLLEQAKGQLQEQLQKVQTQF